MFGWLIGTAVGIFTGGYPLTSKPQRELTLEELWGPLERELLQDIEERYSVRITYDGHGTGAGPHYLIWLPHGLCGYAYFDHVEQDPVHLLTVIEELNAVQRRLGDMEAQPKPAKPVWLT